MIFTGPGAGIALSGFVATALVGLHQPAWIGWLVFAGLALVLSAGCWRVFHGPDLPTLARGTSLQATSSAHHATKRPAGSHAEMALFSLAYGLAGFGWAGRRKPR